jgi:hypothetical protein
MASNIEFDTSELDDLSNMLGRTAEKLVKARALGLARTAESVREQAAATAASYPHATGALAGSLRVSGTQFTKVVGSDRREALFLEFGSPTTGGPRPFLTGPARTEIGRLAEELGKAAIPE